MNSRREFVAHDLKTEIRCAGKDVRWSERRERQRWNGRWCWRRNPYFGRGLWRRLVESKDVSVWFGHGRYGPSWWNWLQVIDLLDRRDFDCESRRRRAGEEWVKSS